MSSCTDVAPHLLTTQREQQRVARVAPQQVPPVPAPAASVQLTSHGQNSRRYMVMGRTPMDSVISTGMKGMKKQKPDKCRNRLKFNALYLCNKEFFCPYTSYAHAFAIIKDLWRYTASHISKDFHQQLHSFLHGMLVGGFNPSEKY